jgi:hypothetical protein
MKKIILLIVLTFIQSLNAVELFSYKLNDNEKHVGNYSIVVNADTTCHFILLKNKDSKKYIIKPFLFTPEKKIIQLDDFISDDETIFMTNHTNNDIITLTSYNEKNKSLLIVDFNIVTKGNYSNIIKDFKKPDLFFSNKDKAILVNLEKSKNDVFIEVVSNSKSTKERFFKIPEDLLKDYKEIKNARIPLESINQAEFVKNGSIKKYRAYTSNSNFYITNNKTDSQISFFKFDLDKDDQVTKDEIEYNFNAPYKYRNTYLTDDKLFVVSSSDNDVTAKSFSLITKKEIGKISALTDLIDIIGNNDISDFIAESKLPSLITTITVNKTVNNFNKIRIDRVNKNTYSYSYNYNWWWFNDFLRVQMQFQMQLMNNVNMGARGFGPNNSYDNCLLTFRDDKKFKFFEFIVDDNFIVRKEVNVETEYPDFNLNKELKEFEDNINIKKFSPAFIKDEIRYIYEDSKEKKIIIDFKKL